MRIDFNYRHGHIRHNQGLSTGRKDFAHYYKRFLVTVGAKLLMLSASFLLLEVSATAAQSSSPPVYNESFCHFSKTTKAVGNTLLLTRCLSHRSLGSYARWLSEEGQYKDALKVHKRSAG